MPEAQPVPPTAAPPDLTGRTLGDYQLLRRLGVGGMGQVYLARQLSLKRDVAVKFLRNDLAADRVALARFQAEAEAVARLNHPNIVHIHQTGEHDGLRYMVLEYVEGRNLRDYLARKGPPEVAVTLGIVRQVALALQKAHDQGIVHRDVKPENILVTRRAEVKVTDFGLSRFFAPTDRPVNLTQSGVTVGTPLYMSPEQVQGKPTDHRTDLYSLGVTCYHLLAGEPPFTGATAFDVALKHVQEQPRPLSDLRPDLPADLCALVHRLMAKDPADRYPSARDVLRDLAKVREGVAAGTGTAPALALSASHPNGVPDAPAPSGPVPPVRPARWGRWVLATVACAAAAAGGAVAYLATNPPGPVPAPAAGLPDVRPPEKIVTARERELLAVLGNREKTPPEEVVRASVELGLLYARDPRRLDEAKDRFERLERENFVAAAGPKKGDPALAQATRSAAQAGVLGRAVVLAHRDTAAFAKESNDLVMRAVADAAPRVPADKVPKAAGPEKVDKYERGYPHLAAFLLKHPDLAHAVADGLNRNAHTLNAATLPAPQLELLRSPPRAVKKD